MALPSSSHGVDGGWGSDAAATWSFLSLRPDDGGDIGSARSVSGEDGGDSTAPSFASSLTARMAPAPQHQRGGDDDASLSSLAVHASVSSLGLLDVSPHDITNGGAEGDGSDTGVDGGAAASDASVVRLADWVESVVMQHGGRCIGSTLGSALMQSNVLMYRSIKGASTSPHCAL